MNEKTANPAKTCVRSCRREKILRTQNLQSISICMLFISLPYSLFRFSFIARNPREELIYA